MWDRKQLHAMNDEENMDEDMEVNRDEEIRDEEQERGGASESACNREP